MSERKIEVVIDPIGNVKVEAHGFNGAGCTSATAPIENALLGAGGVTRELKGDFYNETTNEQTETVQQW